MRAVAAVRVGLPLPAGCSKRPDFSPAQPRRAETHRSAGKAAAPQLTLVSRFTLLWNDARTPLADFFSSLLVQPSGDGVGLKAASCR